MRSQKIVLGTDAEAVEAGIEAGLLQQRRAVAGRIDHHARRQGLRLRAHSGDVRAVPKQTLNSRGQSNLRSVFDSPLPEESKDPANIHDAESRRRVVEYRLVVRRQKAYSRHRMVKTRRDAERIQLIDKA